MKCDEIRLHTGYTGYILVTENSFYFNHLLCCNQCNQCNQYGVLIYARKNMKREKRMAFYTLIRPMRFSRIGRFIPILLSGYTGYIF
jgi:hypothetical protein